MNFEVITSPEPNASCTPLNQSQVKVFSEFIDYFENINDIIVTIINTISCYLNLVLVIYLSHYGLNKKIYSLIRIKSTVILIKSLTAFIYFIATLTSGYNSNLFKAYYAIYVLHIYGQMNTSFTGCIEVVTLYDRLCMIKNTTNKFTKIKTKFITIGILVYSVFLIFPDVFGQEPGPICKDSFKLFLTKFGESDIFKIYFTTMLINIFILLVVYISLLIKVIYEKNKFFALKRTLTRNYNKNENNLTRMIITIGISDFIVVMFITLMFITEQIDASETTAYARFVKSLFQLAERFSACLYPCTFFYFDTMVRNNFKKLLISYEITSMFQSSKSQG